MSKKIKSKSKKILATALIFILTLSLSNIFNKNEVKADSNRYTYNGSNLNTNVYPGFKEKLDALRSAHPNWTFQIMETGLDWNTVISKESGGHWGSPESLIQGKSGDWICSICGTHAYDNGSWYHASEYAIKYYMDSRNWLNDNAYLFQFLRLDYTETSDDAVYKALNGTFLNDRGIASTINSTCRTQNINPFYVIARIIQEQGSDGHGNWKIEDGNNTYYNLFNIGASGNSTQTIRQNALAKARQEGWTSIEKSIIGGTSGTLKSYINNKQNTLYLNKFDVESYNGLYSWQFMQNIEAPKSESQTMYSKISGAGLLGQNLTFIIPVYYNMDASASGQPAAKVETSTKNIKLKSGHSDWNIRGEMSTSSSIVGTVASPSTIVLSDQRADGWYRIILTDGTTGYIWFDTNAWEETSDVTNCNETVFLTGSDVRLRAGPGLNEPVLTTLNEGDVVTRIDNTGRYNFGGIIWDRVKLSDGRQGFVSRQYLSANVNTTNSKKDDTAKVVTMEPGAAYKDIINKKFGSSVIIKNGSGAEIKEGLIGTGYTITIDNNTYTAVKLADMDGDGVIDSADLLKITKHLMKVKTLTDSYAKAADINADGTIDSADLLKITKYLMKVSAIELN